MGVVLEFMNANTKVVINPEYIINTKCDLEEITTQGDVAEAKNLKARKIASKFKTPIEYTFEMLHEDDSTDDEDKSTYKRPEPPLWSRKHIRGPALMQQESISTDIIDSLFSVQPMTPDLRSIFPTISQRHLKRRSSAIWFTPPRYSELPKY